MTRCGYSRYCTAEGPCLSGLSLCHSHGTSMFICARLFDSKNQLKFPIRSQILSVDTPILDFAPHSSINNSTPFLPLAVTLLLSRPGLFACC